jgi:hypothetical protein
MTTTRTYPAAPTTPASNVRSVTGTVIHRGRWIKAPHLTASRYPTHATPGWIEAQACGNARNLAYGLPTDEAATCKRCGS